MVGLLFQVQIVFQVPVTLSTPPLIVESMMIIIIGALISINKILLDYKLGDMFGDSVARRIKEYNGVKIILFSAYELDDSLLEELEENDYISTYIEKPIHLTNLIEIVAKTIS